MSGSESRKQLGLRLREDTETGMLKALKQKVKRRNAEADYGPF
jgi:hypothetical protein